MGHKQHGAPLRHRLTIPRFGVERLWSVRHIMLSGSINSGLEVLRRPECRLPRPAKLTPMAFYPVR